MILIKLIAAHFCADFFLQSDKMAKGKRTSWIHMSIHSLINAAVVYLFLGQWTLWIIPLIVFVTHFIIDYIKIMFGNELTGWFIADQLMHILVLLGCWSLFFGDISMLSGLVNELWTSSSIWLTTLTYALMTMPASLLVESFFKRWQHDVPSYSGLPGGGKWIGYLERVLVVTFVITNNISGVGFLMTAKSVFRFSDIQKGDLRMTEYMLLGTLLSFAIGLTGGFILKLAL